METSDWCWEEADESACESSGAKAGLEDEEESLRGTGGAKWGEITGGEQEVRPSLLEHDESPEIGA